MATRAWGFGQRILQTGALRSGHPGRKGQSPLVPKIARSLAQADDHRTGAISDG